MEECDTWGRAAKVAMDKDKRAFWLVQINYNAIFLFSFSPSASARGSEGCKGK